MKKLSVIIIIIIIIAIAIAYVFFPSKNTGINEQNVINIKQNDVILHYENGLVEVNGKLISGNIFLEKGDIIETKNGLASVILYKSIIVTLEQNTKIIIDDILKEHPKIIQEKGETWNKFTNIYGNSYTITSGNTIASVRATEFGISNNKIVVVDGVVSYQIDDRLFNVSKNEVVEKSGIEIISRSLTQEEILLIKEKEKRVLDVSNKFSLFYKPAFDDVGIEPRNQNINIIENNYEIFDKNLTPSDKNVREEIKNESVLTKPTSNIDSSNINVATSNTNNSTTSNQNSLNYNDYSIKSESNPKINNVKSAQKLTNQYTNESGQ